MSSLDDELLRALLSKALDGDSSSYRQALELIQHWASDFFRRRTTSAAAVHDLVQETLIAVHKKRCTYDISRPVLPWLLAIAHYKWIDYLRDHYRRAEVDLSAELAVEDSAESMLGSLALRNFMERLTPQRAAVIDLVKLQGYSIEEAARMTGQSEALVRVNIHRGLKQLIAMNEE